MPRPFSHVFSAVALLTASLPAAVTASAHAQDVSPSGPARDSVARVVRGDAPRPRLAVVLSIDQFRADYLTRLGDLFLPASPGRGRLGGFRYLMSQGAHFANARFEHYPLYTGPGHAVLLTGSHPYKNGIVGNEWWDPKNRRPVYCVDDARWKVVGAAEGSRAKPMGPLNLRSSTIGDELKLATAGRARVVAVALKDRAAILMSGHATDSAVWFDDAGGRWITSTAYAKDGKLPAWAEKVNSEAIPDKALGTTWTPSLSPEVLAARSFDPKLVPGAGPYGLGTKFPHKVGAEKTSQNYRAFTLTPAANAYVFETAKRAVAAEGLGKDDVPDLLCVNLSTNDYLGHAFGPYSPEATDLTVQTDRLLADFLTYLDKNVPGGMKSVVFVLTADHGVTPIPEDASEPPFGLNAGRFEAAEVVKVIGGALTARFGEPAGGSWFSRGAEAEGGRAATGEFVEGFVYLSPEAVASAIAGGKARDRRDLERAACDAVNGAGIQGVWGCYGKSQVLEGAVGDHDLGKHLARAVHPQLTGDLIVLSEQMYLAGSAVPAYATSHGTPYAYDTHVPVVVSAPGLIKPGVYAGKAAPSDIAPTLSLLLGVELPSGCDGSPLVPALQP